MDSYLEYTAVACGVIYVALATRGIIWCWPFGILSALLYIFINAQHDLYQDAILQSYYVLAGCYGWWMWHKKETQADTAGIISFSPMQNLKWLLTGMALFPAMGYAFSNFGNSLPYLDAAVTVFSFIATWMTARKILQSWLFWIAIDITAAIMYFLKGLHATTGLYLFFTAAAIYGYYEWRKQMRAA